MPRQTLTTEITNLLLIGNTNKYIFGYLKLQVRIYKRASFS